MRRAPCGQHPLGLVDVSFTRSFPAADHRPKLCIAPPRRPPPALDDIPLLRLSLPVRPWPPHLTTLSRPRMFHLLGHAVFSSLPRPRRSASIFSCIRRRPPMLLRRTQRPRDAFARRSRRRAYRYGFELPSPAAILHPRLLGVSIELRDCATIQPCSWYRFRRARLSKLPHRALVVDAHPRVCSLFMASQDSPLAVSVSGPEGTNRRS
ncbi:hypothetical protein R3P38DRAFT_2838909 [Favolaschia claudopus]|uniref:Uncharacterized protein n=1 Tax=Favolaschia claudopus TaxID=2862362 RepID=A0AAW0E804_9AGAR